MPTLPTLHTYRMVGLHGDGAMAATMDRFSGKGYNFLAPGGSGRSSAGKALSGCSHHPASSPAWGSGPPAKARTAQEGFFYAAEI